MHIASNLVILFFLTLIICSSLSMSGVLFSYLDKDSRTILTFSQKSTLGFTATLTLLTLVAYYSAIVEIPTAQILRITVYSYLLLVLLFIAKSKKEFLKWTLLNVGFSVLLAIWIYLPSLFMKFRNGSGIGLFSAGNNDIYYFASLSNQFIQSGFNNSGQLPAIDLNIFSKIVYFEPTAIISAISSAFFIPTWKSALLTIFIGSVFNTLCVQRLVQTVLPKIQTKYIYLISFVFSSSSILIYVYSHMFLAQIFSIGISILLISNLIEYFWNENKTKILVFEMFLLVILSIFTYPIFLIAFIGFILAFSVIGTIVFQIKLDLRGLIGYGVAVIFAFAITYPYLLTSLKSIFDMRNGEFGWALYILHPLNLLISQNVFGIEFPKEWIVLLYSISVGLFLWIMRRGNLLTRSKFPSGVFILVTSLLTLTYMVYANRSFSSYQQWKLISYFFPVVILFLLTQLVMKVKSSAYLLVFLAGVLSLNPVLTWGLDPKVGSFYGTKDFESLAGESELRDIIDLNVDLGISENTLLPAILDKQKLFFVSPSYYPISANGVACTLVRNDNSNYDNIVPINATYGLAKLPTQKC
jgi:hypothetical protein